MSSQVQDFATDLGHGRVTLREAARMYPSRLSYVDWRPMPPRLLALPKAVSD
jgi:hypothetical protein